VESARCLRALVDRDYLHVHRIRVVVDNLSAHTPRPQPALYQAFPASFPGKLSRQAFPAPEARRMLRRLEFHYTPKHASWLNRVESAIGVVKGQCLDRRLSEPEALKVEIAAWEHARNEAGARIRGMFTTEKARTKTGRADPQPASPDEPIKPS
jgi:hypothetical protein